MSMRRIIFLPPLASMAAPWWLLDEGGSVLQSGRLEPDGALLEGDVPTVAVVSGADVAVRWLLLPKGRPVQVLAAARWQMGDVLAQDMSGSVVAIGPQDAQGRTAVAAVANSLMAGWHAWLSGAGLDPVAMVPDCLCIAQDEYEAVVAPTLWADQIVVAEGMSVTVQPELVELLLAGRKARYLAESEAEAALLRGGYNPVLNLFDGLAPVAKREGKVWRRVVVLAACALISPLVLMLAALIRDDMKSRSALDEAKATAAAYMPDTATNDDPLAVVESRLSEMAPAGGHVRTVAALFETLEPVTGAGISEINAVGPELRATVRLPDQAAIDVMRDGLAQRGLSMSACDPVSEDGAVICNLSAEAL